MTNLQRIWLATLWLLCGAPAALGAEEMVTEVIDLRYRSAEEVRSLITPLVPPPGTVGALQNQLIVRTSPRNLEELKKVLTKIDFVPRRLLITVKKEGSQTATERRGSVSGSVGGRDARVTVPGRRVEQGGGVEVRRGDDRVGARVLNSDSAASDNSMQSVQVLEGNTAFVQIGQSAPVVSRTIIQTPQGPRTVESTDMVTAQRGFRAKPRVHGDQVNIEITSSNDRLSEAQSGSIDSQHLQTVVSGRLGEWIEMGGVDQSRERSENSVVYRSRDAASDQRRLLIKVDEVR
jgi:type II secretory pathway component GspD/PulD (secretin)